MNKTNEEIQVTKGIGNVRFEKFSRNAKIRSPLEKFEVVEQQIEFRKDPLIRHWSRINKLRAERVKQASTPSENFESNLQSLVENSGKKCFFCPENVTKSTPKFVEELGLGERITVGDFNLFPNLFVFSEYHAVGTLGNEHFTPLSEFTSKIWQEAIEGSIKFFQAVHNYDKTVKYPSINFNFLPPSASSIIHPHIQIIQDIKATKLTEKLLQKSQQYTKESKSNYWLDLIASEKKLGERFITENEFMTWLATYSPFGKNELTGIVTIPKTDITTFTKEDSRDLAVGITKALKALYYARGATSVNMALYLGPIGEDKSDDYRINLKIVSRPDLLPNYTGDIGFMELLHSEPIAAANPESIAETVREYF
ncbi:MAG: hypothetical protein KGD59_00785 [Candidatus Heimdallarchaeota archaeon]|nr:hypothetical protein [Candidatus Heimdallarchaeota archaeon]MBY8993053.1 hypothetical protein [Candidatus Heimdallarchaeota archaeon]